MEKRHNKSVLITGCSSGIGLCVAQGLAERGYDVIATARKEEDVATLKSSGLKSFRLDLSDEKSIAAAVSATLDTAGGEIYALFNNGAYGLPGAVEDLSIEAMRDQFEVNVFGTMALTNMVIPVMRNQGYGRIIQNSSVLGFAALPFRGAYNASKFALEGFSDTLRLELKGSGIYVSIIEPGPITSEFRKNAYGAFKRYIDPTNSAHKSKYMQIEKRLRDLDRVDSFTLPPEAVLGKVIRALESRRPKIRYYVTFPTHLLGFLRRVLPFAALDRILQKG